MIAFLLTATSILPEAIGLVASIVEAITVVALCIIRIIKLVVDIKAALKDSNPNDADQVKDLLQGALSDIKDLTGKDDTDSKGEQK